MKLELPATVRVPPGVIERDSTLPQLRSHPRIESDDLIESRDGFRNAAFLKITDGLAVNGADTTLRGGEDSDEHCEVNGHCACYPTASKSHLVKELREDIP